eukprot:snap_masked-scaffold_39-processed-gene-1.48-mRNA-1 protein AED:1.00 eAED:1.00 QI:0/-1/0/0/-1/1/1/0/91
MMDKKLTDLTYNIEASDPFKLFIHQVSRRMSLRQFHVQMSNLITIEVELKSSSAILRSDGYHQTKEEERFLNVKFEVLRKGGIISPEKSPV